MPRGGKREGAGAPGKWKHGKTTSIRVPVALVDQILEAAYKIDQGLPVAVNGAVKTIDLAGISLISVQGRKGVAIADLMKAGYEIKPHGLAMSVKNQMVLR